MLFVECLMHLRISINKYYLKKCKLILVIYKKYLHNNYRYLHPERALQIRRPSRKVLWCNLNQLLIHPTKTAKYVFLYFYLSDLKVLVYYILFICRPLLNIFLKTFCNQHIVRPSLEKC